MNQDSLPSPLASAQAGDAHLFVYVAWGDAWGVHRHDIVGGVQMPSGERKLVCADTQCYRPSRYDARAFFMGEVSPGFVQALQRAVPGERYRFGFSSLVRLPVRDVSVGLALRPPGFVWLQADPAEVLAPGVGRGAVLGRHGSMSMSEGAFGTPRANTPVWQIADDGQPVRRLGCVKDLGLHLPQRADMPGAPVCGDPNAQTV